MTVVGAVFMPHHPPERLRDVAVAADAAALDELWLWEDCFAESGVAPMAAALAWTDRLRLGVGVLPVPLRNVALTAMEAAALHRMFPGRVEIGVGHGVLDWMGQVGARAASPMTLLREYVAALRELLSGHQVTANGRYVRLRDVQLEWPPPAGAAVHVAAVGAKTIALAGEVGDGLVLTAETAPDEVRAARAIFDAGRAAGAPPGRVTCYLLAITGADAGARLADERRFWGAPDQAGVAGDAGAIADAVHRLAEAGADAVILQPARADDPVEYVRFVAEQVRPLVK